MSDETTLTLPQLREPRLDLRRLAPLYEGRAGSVVAVAAMLALAAMEWARLFSGHGPRPLMFLAILGIAAVLVAGRVRLGVVEAERARAKIR
jgi:hypothetical protein